MGDLDNPTLDVREYKEGDFVEGIFLVRPATVGIVTEVNGENILARKFDGGFPSAPIDMSPKYGSVKKISEDEALDHFRRVSESLGSISERRADLLGAVFARRQHYLDCVIGEIEKGWKSTIFDFPRKAPETGVYVLMGYYSGQGPSHKLEGIAISPRLSEGTVSKVMKDVYPEGFGDIPHEARDLPGTSCGSLVCYRAFEVPEKAIRFVREPKKLELIFTPS